MSNEKENIKQAIQCLLDAGLSCHSAGAQALKLLNQALEVPDDGAFTVNSFPIMHFSCPCCNNRYAFGNLRGVSSWHCNVCYSNYTALSISTESVKLVSTGRG